MDHPSLDSLSTLPARQDHQGSDDGAGLRLPLHAHGQLGDPGRVAAARHPARIRPGRRPAGAVPDEPGTAKVPDAPLQGADEDSDGEGSREGDLRQGAAAVPRDLAQDPGRDRGVAVAAYRAKRFLTTNQTLAGRSASRRMYQANQASP